MARIGRIKKKQPDGIIVGVGYVYSTSVYSGVESRQLPMPFISYKKGDFSIRGLTANYTILDMGILRTDLIIDGKFFSGGYEAEDSSSLTGMDERKGTITGGGQVSIKIWRFNLRAKLMSDIADNHNGIQGNISLALGFPVSLFFKNMPFTLIGGSFGYQYNNRKYNNYYYGVRDLESTSTRLSYNAKESWNPYFSTFIRVKLSKKWSLMTIYNRNFLPDEIKNSPIVSSETKSSIVSFLSYRF